MRGAAMTQNDQMSAAELAREMSRLEAAIAAASSEEERQRCNTLLSEVRFELMKRGRIAQGGGCAQ